MPNFQKIYEWLFNSFRIKGSSSLVQTFEQENVKHIMIIRRSWIYGILVNLLLLLIIAMTVVNITLVLDNFTSSPLVGYLISGLITLSTVLTVYSGLVYLFHFHRAHSKNNNILDIRDGQMTLEWGSVIFAAFFNQVTLSYFLCIAIVLFEIYLLFVSGSFTVLLPYLGIFALFVQIVLIVYYRARMIDLEMDYILVVPGKVYFIDQIGVHTNVQTLQLMSNIKIIQSSYPNFIGSFFDFWTIEITLDTVTSKPLNNRRTLHMHYVTSPIETVNRINKLLVDYDRSPLIIDTILKELGLSGQNPDEPEITDRIGTYLIEYEEHLKKLFAQGSPQEKNEIMRIYKKYMPHHAGF